MAKLSYGNIIRMKNSCKIKIFKINYFNKKERLHKKMVINEN